MEIKKIGHGIYVEGYTPEQLKRIQQLDKQQNTRPKLITRKQAAEILGCCVMSIKRAERRGHLTAVRFSARRVRLDEAEVLEFARRGVEVKEAAQ